MILIDEAIEAIHRHRGDALVVGTMTPNRYWEQVSEKKELDLPIFGAMGKASSVGLGWAWRWRSPTGRSWCWTGTAVCS